MPSFKNKKLRLYHQDSMVYTKEFLLLKVPREVGIQITTPIGTEDAWVDKITFKYKHEY